MNEDGAHETVADRFQALNDVGFTGVLRKEPFPPYP
jgi:hypothetical protein